MYVRTRMHFIDPLEMHIGVRYTITVKIMRLQSSEVLLSHGDTILNLSNNLYGNNWDKHFESAVVAVLVYVNKISDPHCHIIIFYVM